MCRPRWRGSCTGLKACTLVRQTLSLLCEGSGHVIRTFAAWLRHAVGSQAPVAAAVAVAHLKLNFYGRWLDAARGGRVGRGGPFSKLTFVRAQDLCINVPSILATCVCSFQMRITTVTTTTTRYKQVLRCVN